MSEPTLRPTVKPTVDPSVQPTVNPTDRPTNRETNRIKAKGVRTKGMKTKGMKTKGVEAKGMEAKGMEAKGMETGMDAVMAEFSSRRKSSQKGWGRAAMKPPKPNLSKHRSNKVGVQSPLEAVQPAPAELLQSTRLRSWGVLAAGVVVLAVYLRQRRRTVPRMGYLETSPAQSKS